MFLDVPSIEVVDDRSKSIDHQKRSSFVFWSLNMSVILSEPKEKLTARTNPSCTRMFSFVARMNVFPQGHEDSRAF